MTFNSYTFALFFLLVLVLDRWLASWTIRKPKPNMELTKSGKERA